MLSSDNSANGLNLTAANYVLIIDPIRTNDVVELKKIEDQAIGRANRLGQTRTVNVVRFITKNTIEERLWNSQKELLK